MIGRDRRRLVGVICCVCAVVVMGGFPAVMNGVSGQPAASNNTTTNTTVSQGPSPSNGSAPSAAGNGTNETNATAPTRGGTLGSVGVNLTYPVGLRFNGTTRKAGFPVTVTKMNKSTFRVRHIHGEITKTWFFPNNTSTNPRFNGDHVNDLWKTDQRAGWPGRLGPQTDKQRLASEIKDTKIFRKKISPFAQLRHEEKVKSDGGGVLPSIKETAKRWMEAAVAWLGAQFAKGVNAFVGAFNYLLIRLPTPGQATKPMTWLTATNGWWGAVRTLYGTVAGLAALLLIAPIAQTIDTVDRQRRYEYGKGVALAAIMIVFGLAIIAPVLHVSNGLSMALAPDGSDFMETPSDFAKLGLGIILGVLLILIQSSLVFIAVLTKIAQWFLLHFLIAMWPLLWACRVQPVETMQKIGNGGIAAFVTLILLTIVQSAVLRFLVEIPFVLPGNAVGTVGNIVIVTLTIIIGLLVAFVGLPYLAIKKVVPTAVQLSIRRDWMQAKRKINDRFGTDDTEHPAPVGGGPEGGLSYTRTTAQQNNQQVNMFFMDGNAPDGNGDGSSGDGGVSFQKIHHKRRHTERHTEDSTPGQTIDMDHSQTQHEQ